MFLTDLSVLVNVGVRSKVDARFRHVELFQEMSSKGSCRVVQDKEVNAWLGRFRLIENLCDIRVEEVSVDLDCVCLFVVSDDGLHKLRWQVASHVGI